MIVHQIPVGQMQNFTYVVYDESTREFYNYVVYDLSKT